MRTYDEMMKQIMDKAQKDERIRAVTMEGSRANKNAVHDQYSDFDICYIVTDIRDFTKDKKWTAYFGEILIMQCPDDCYNHPYDYNSHEKFTYLMQFTDGNRIDLTLIDVKNIAKELLHDEPRIVLLNKDNFKELVAVEEENAFYIEIPSETEYNNTCNEFRWISIYVTKGLCRQELYYAKYCYDVILIQMFMKMMNWKIAYDHEFHVTTGAKSKYLKRFLNEEELERFKNIFPNGAYQDIWDKLFLLYDYFAENAAYVAEKLGFFFDADETKHVRAFLCERKLSAKE